MLRMKVNAAQPEEAIKRMEGYCMPATHSLDHVGHNVYAFKCGERFETDITQVCKLLQTLQNEGFDVDFVFAGSTF